MTSASAPAPHRAVIQDKQVQEQFSCDERQMIDSFIKRDPTACCYILLTFCMFQSDSVTSVRLFQISPFISYYYLSFVIITYYYYLSVIIIIYYHHLLLLFISYYHHLSLLTCILPSEIISGSTGFVLSLHHQFGDVSPPSQYPGHQSSVGLNFRPPSAPTLQLTAWQIWANWGAGNTER